MPLYNPASSTGTDVGLGFPQAPSGSYFVQNILESAAHSTGTGALNRVEYTPILLADGTLDRIAVNHLSSPTASEVVRLGICNSTSAKPSTKLLDAGTVDLSTAAAVKAITISQVVTRGLYWLAVVRQGPSTTANLVTWSIPVNGTIATSLVAPADPGSLYNSQRGFYVETGVSGALPASASPAAAASLAPGPILAGVRYV